MITEEQKKIMNHGTLKEFNQLFFDNIDDDVWIREAQAYYKKLHNL